MNIHGDVYKSSMILSFCIIEYSRLNKMKFHQKIQNPHWTAFIHSTGTVLPPTDSSPPIASALATGARLNRPFSLLSLPFIPNNDGIVSHGIFHGQAVLSLCR
jgi:hypothetical protein